MSMELDIVPCQGGAVTWAALRDRWRQRLGARALDLLGPSPQLHGVSDREQLEDGDTLTPSRCLYFDVPGARTLSLCVAANAGNLDEHEYLSDYARNLEGSIIEDLARSWREVGFYFEVESRGGRSETEPEVLISLAAALADLCSGRVIVMHERVFDLPVGVYTADEFAAARWLRTATTQR